MRSLRPRPFSWYEDAMRLTEDESIARMKERRKAGKKMEHTKNLEKLFDAIDEEADRRELNAAHAGERGDYGAARLREQVKFYQMGMRGEIPQQWKQYEKLLDPEYAEWQRLNKKFGGTR